MRDFDRFEKAKKTSASTFPFSAVLNRLLDCVEHQQPEVRHEALALVIQMYKQFGFKRIESLVKQVGQKTLETLSKDVPEAESYLKIPFERAPLIDP